MKYYITIILTVVTIILKSQEQWFPAKYDETTKTYVPDTNIAFPVAYIRSHKSVYHMFAQKSPYYKVMKYTKNGYYSDGLSLSVPMGYEDTLRVPYSQGKYLFQKQKDKEKAILIIKRVINQVNKTDTLLFIKSKTRIAELKFEWG